jgi:hypothetical protein
MKSRKVIHTKEVWPDGTIIEMVVWQVPHAVQGSVHLFKYRLYCGRKHQCLVLFDNERGKGDHRHIKGQETPYRFKTLEQLIIDFEREVRKLV